MITDFTYDSKSLKDLGYILCYFGDAGDVDAVTTDSQRDFGSVSMFNGTYMPFTSVSYKDNYVPQLSICKDPCGDESVITLDEMRALKRWLSPPSPRKLQVLNDQEYADIYWEGIFNVEEVFANGQRIGANLTFNTNRPFAMRTGTAIEGTAEANGTITIENTSDEETYLYPDMVITCVDAGDLTLTNAYDSRQTIVKNCVAGEIITFNHNLTIESSVASHSLYKDFNFQFLRLWNINGNGSNEIKTATKIQYKINFDTAVKVVLA